MKKQIVSSLAALILLGSATGFCADAPAQPAAAPAPAPATVPVTPVIEMPKGFFISPTVGMDVSVYSGVNIGGGVGFVGQVMAQYFFTPTVGVYTGASFVGRKMLLNSVGNPVFLDVPLGMAFQYSLIPTVRNVIGLGVFYGFPLGDYNDSGGAVALQGSLGLDVMMNTYFPVAENVELGLGVNFRFGFNSPFQTVANATLLSVQLGLTARLRL